MRKKPRLTCYYLNRGSKVRNSAYLDHKTSGKSAHYLDYLDYLDGAQLMGSHFARMPAHSSSSTSLRAHASASACLPQALYARAFASARATSDRSTIGWSPMGLRVGALPHRGCNPHASPGRKLVALEG